MTCCFYAFFNEQKNELNHYNKSVFSVEGLKLNLLTKISYRLEHYDPKKYWRYREKVMSPKTPKLLRFYYWHYLKKCDAFNCASIATAFNGGVTFLSPPVLPHGLKGIVIHRDAVLGNNVVILQNVTIGQRNNDGHCVIGDNVLIGAGAIILGAVKIGDNAQIGAGAVVVHDIPEGATAVGNPARIISK
jgi:serine O-acetyltransferase